MSALHFETPYRDSPPLDGYDAASQGDDATAENPGQAREALTASVAQVAAAFSLGEVDRLLILDAGTDAFEREPGVCVARRLAASGATCVVIDMTGGGRIAEETGLAEDAAGMGDFGDGAATLADVIHRDRHTRVHVVPSRGYDLGKAAPAQRDDLGVLLSAFSQAYDFALLVCDADQTDRAAPLINERTAVVIAADHAAGRCAAAGHAVRALGIDDVVIVEPDA